MGRLKWEKLINTGMKEKFKVMKIFSAIFAIVGLLFVVAVLMALPTMWLWNWLMPTIFGVVKISFWQALGLNLLSGILFQRSSSNSKK